MAELNLNSIEKVYLDRKVLDRTELVARVYQFWSAEQVQVVDVEPYQNEKGALSAAQFDRSKRELFITDFKGQFFKRCPGARPGLTCCNYFVLNLGLQCNMNCSYCYLQSFINSPVMKLYANLSDALDEMRTMAKTMSGQPLRVGTGEVIDSLSLDELSLHSRELVAFFRDYPHWQLEFKTKSSKVDQFLDVPHAGNVVVSFSLNPENVIAREEHGTATLEARLQAARRACDKGFPLAFHLDPMLEHEGWRDSYAQMVERICYYFKPHEVNVMSVGALRFQPEQRHMMRERFGHTSMVVQAEVFPSRDGKMRYDQKVREEMYQFLLKQFQSRSANWKIFLCMESPETWLNAVGTMPKSQPGLSVFFDNNVVRMAQTAQQVSNEIQPGS